MVFISLIDPLSLADKTIKLWKVSERDKRAEGYNLKEDSGMIRDPSSINSLRVSYFSQSRYKSFLVLLSCCSQNIRGCYVTLIVSRCMSRK